MTEKQHLKYIPNTDTEQPTKNAIERTDEFVNRQDVRALNILEIQQGLLVLYEDV
jgi:hypothetical protein